MSPTRVAVLIATLLLPSGALAHPGGLNADGCHTNRKTGDYHCHRKGQARALSDAPVTLMPKGVAYRNCTEARRAGAAPVRRGDPGYALHLDRDRDGIGCE